MVSCRMVLPPQADVPRQETKVRGSSALTWNRTKMHQGYGTPDQASLYCAGVEGCKVNPMEQLPASPCPTR